jgi:predicted short-subunit dehydrogenase-like oxidoreductase (DUF2520 family)
LKKPGNSDEIRSVVIMGAGNLAWHLGHHLLKAGIQIIQVFNRTTEPGELLAAELNSTFTGRLDYLTENADIYILAVSDEAIDKMLHNGWFSKGHLVVHTAGSVAMDVFAGKAINYGVLYPLQTFTKVKPVDFKQIPLFIEANNDVNLKRIEHLAMKLSASVHNVDSEKRMYLHLAAVIVSNFTNHMFALAEKLLLERNLTPDLLIPLIQETVDKAIVMSPLRAQTGPAIRGNTAIIEKHLALLEPHPEIRELYRVITESIILNLHNFPLPLQA